MGTRDWRMSAERCRGRGDSTDPEGYHGARAEPFTDVRSIVVVGRRGVLVRIARWAGLVVLVLCLVAVSGWGYLMAAYPRLAPARALKVAGTPEQLARGQYLSHHVVGCTDCHGERDWTKYSAPQVRSQEGQGGMTFRLDVATLHAPNITPPPSATGATVKCCGR